MDIAVTHHSLGIMTSTDSRDFVQLVPIRVAAYISSDLTMVLRSPKLLLDMFLGCDWAQGYSENMMYRGRL